MKGRGEQADAVFYSRWRQSPFSDDYLGKLARHLVRELKLGKQSDTTDFLGVSFSALDGVGHDFGPHSHEVQDTLARLDVAIGELLNFLDREVGRGKYVLALTADHGVAPVPVQMADFGFDAGQVATADVAARVETALAELWGPGKYIERMTYPDVYFAPGVYDRLRGDSAALRKVEETILSVPGVWRSYRSEEMARLRDSKDRLGRAAALSFYPGRSGDLLVIPRPYWFFVGSAASRTGGGATHGTSHDYDSRVPLILFGFGIQPGEYMGPSSPADVAPTLAKLAGILLGHAEGRVLAEALTGRQQPSRPPSNRRGP
jgi:predicted AlkP superfamily pyrophosphatase or phosphodiesterase